MFLRGLNGEIVNLLLTGEINVGQDWYGSSYVKAVSGGGSEDHPLLWVVLFQGTKEECKDYIDRIWTAISAEGKTIVV